MVSMSYSLSMSLEGQSAGLNYSVSMPCFEGSSFLEAFNKVDKICEEILPRKLVEVQQLVCHLKNTKNKIKKGELDPLAKAEDDV